MPSADAAECARITRSHARTFALASHFLPASKRRAAFALYAFCRVADDMVDAAGEGTSPLVVARDLAEYERQLRRAIAGRPEGAVFRELHWAMREYDVPESVLHELLAGIARDLEPVHYETWAELAVYCEGVASTVGVMCTHVFGVAEGDRGGRTRALRYARTLGVAMQLTNILRDVGEDGRRGRLYLPHEDLARFDLTAAEMLAPAPTLARDERWRALMAFEVDRARALYETALPGIALLAPDARRCAAACAWGYAGILGAIEQNGYDTLTTRARLGTAARVAVLWEAWRGVNAPAPTAADLPALERDGTRRGAAGGAPEEMIEWA
jgi:phytoene synthase